VDKTGIVRGIYDGLKQDEIQQLISDSQMLLSK
jgi:hypothetical protein